MLKFYNSATKGERETTQINYRNMTAVLELLFRNGICPLEIVDFIIGKTVKANKQHYMNEVQLQSDFLPFFLNYLRDSTNHLICSVNSSTLTPAKTPTSAQKLRQSTKNTQKRRGNRTKLFSPNVSSQTEHSFHHSTPENNYSPTNFSCNTPSSTKSNLSGSSRDRSRRDERSWKKDTSFSPARSITPVKSESLTLAQYLNTPESVGKQDSLGRRLKKHSPSVVDLEQVEGSNYRTPSPSGSHKRSSGKKSGGSGRKPRNAPQGVETPTSFKLDTQDFPAIGAAKSIKPRRIAPTPVSKDTKGSGRVNNVLFTLPNGSSNDSNYPQNAFRSPQKSFKEERELLRQEKLKRSDSLTQEDGMFSPSRMVPRTPTKPPFGLLDDIIEVVPKRDLVTNSEKLDILAELYSLFLQECLIPNLPVEIYFLVQLLTSHGSTVNDEASNLGNCDLDDINYLATVHNCVYFAVKVLERQSRILSLFDNTTVRLLCESANIAEFNPNFGDHFLSESMIPSRSASLPMFTSPVNAVHFSADTDNRQNFPSNQSFHGFKKQRDQFYELLREWEDNHRLPGWNMKEMQATKIRSVIKQATDPTNYIHFARLFRSQLVTMCQEDSSLLTGSISEDQHLLSQLKKSNPEKFKRLQERFFTPSRSLGPCPPPSFNGCQEFFRDFIVSAESYIFNQHLIDSFSAKIIEVNEISIVHSENQDQLLKEEQREYFKLNLKMLRLLSKFLGFVVFLPYRGNNLPIDSVSDDVIALRNKCQPPLDLSGYVMSSFVDRRLVFTIPWVIEFLSMMDSTSPHLQYYQNLIITLVDIYRFSSLRFSAEMNTSWFFLICIMGWLFELPMFPPALFFNALSSSHQSSLPTLLPTSNDDIFLDDLNIVDRKFLYSCCPYLAEVKALLTGTINGSVNKSTPMKKITPVSANPLPKPLITEKPIQVQLEDNFFNNHSQSLKKTVEFVSKRISSNCIKCIDATLVPEHLTEASNALKTLAIDGGDSERSKEVDRLKTRMVEIEKRESKLTQEKAVSFAHSFIEERCTSALKTLLPADIKQDVMSVVTIITIRLATTRVLKWISTQIPGAIHSELSATLSKMMKAHYKDNQKQKLVIVPALQHNPESYSPSEIIDRLKRIMCRCSCNVPINLGEVRDEVNAVKTTLATRQDMTPLAYHTIHLLVAELIAVLMVQYPDDLSRAVTQTSKTMKPDSADVINAEEHTGSFGPLRAADVSEIKSHHMKSLHCEDSKKNISMQNDFKSVKMFNSEMKPDSSKEVINETVITEELTQSQSCVKFDEKNFDNRSSESSDSNAEFLDCRSVLGCKQLPLNIQKNTTLLNDMMSIWEGDCPLPFPVGIITCNKLDVLIEHSKHRQKILSVRQSILDKLVSQVCSQTC